MNKTYATMLQQRRSTQESNRSKEETREKNQYTQHGQRNAMDPDQTEDDRDVTRELITNRKRTGRDNNYLSN
jgi:hypothetical protein